MYLVSTGDEYTHRGPRYGRDVPDVCTQTHSSGRQGWQANGAIRGDRSMYHRILVPLDGSERAEKVLPLAKEEAKHHGATIVLLRVIPPLRHTLMTVPNLLEEGLRQAIEFAEDYLARTADRVQADGVEVETEILEGPPANRILEFAEESQCDLIVIGSHGDAGALQWRFGSVANKVIKTRTSMPVLVINT
jgi:nucleotide-binding universal stress UspA family protein